MSNALDSLKLHSTVVADSGDVASIIHYTPQDATTNPSLILAASSDPKYAHFLTQAKDLGAKAAAAQGGDALSWSFDYLICLFGVEILKVIPGYVLQWWFDGGSV
jgi:transaldolase